MSLLIVMEFHSDRLSAAIEEHFSDIGEVTSIKKITTGYQSIIFEINEEFIFKVARNKHAGEAFEQERQFFLHSQGQIGRYYVPYPKYFIRSGDIQFGTIGYKKLEGTPLSTVEITPHWMGRQLANLLDTIHSLPPSHIENVSTDTQPPPRFELSQLFDRVEAYLESHLSAEDFTTFKIWWDEAVTNISKYIYEPVVIHGDFWADNLLVEPQTKQLIGIVDFGNLGIGDPLVDVTPLLYISEDLVEQVFSHSSSHRATPKIFSYLWDLLGLRELQGLDYGLKVDSVDEDQIDKLMNVVNQQ